MKVLIWIGCMILNYIIQNISKAIVSSIPASGDEGIILIGLLSGLLSAASIGLCIWLAITLCKKWDWYKVLKKAAEANMTVSEYGKHGLSEEFLAKVENMFNTVAYEQAKSKLKSCVKKGKITKEQYTILLKEYTNVK
jgi:hypothetical protein